MIEATLTPLTKAEFLDRLLAETQPELAEFVAFFEGTPGTRWAKFPVFWHTLNGTRIPVVHDKAAEGLTFMGFDKAEAFNTIKTPTAPGSRRQEFVFSARELNANLTHRQFGTLVVTNLAFFADDRLNPIGDGTACYDVRCTQCGRPSQWSAKMLLQGYAKFGDKLTHTNCGGGRKF
jgi:hypothetical protein